jgi:capsular polysaccharide biosynthesis protein
MALDTNDEWYETEESTRRSMISEVQRIRRRTVVRPIPVLLLAALLTGAIVYKVATKKRIVEAEIVLALTEGTMSADERDVGIPVNDLRNYVAGQLMPKSKLAEIIERRDLFRLRKKMGMPWAINELRESIELDVWHNSFVYYDPDAPDHEASTRIGLTVGSDDPEEAFLIAHDLGQVVIQEVREQRVKLAKIAAQEIAAYKDAMTKRMAALEKERTERVVAQTDASNEGKASVVQAIQLRLIEIDQAQKEVEKTLSQINTSQDALADRIAEAGLDLVVEIVSERRPLPPDNRGLLLVMIGVVVGLGSLLGAALVLGSFDSRVHDADDVARLGLPVLGHVPGFPGDRLGSLAARGVQAGVPSYSRWRAQR